MKTFEKLIDGEIVNGVQLFEADLKTCELVGEALYNLTVIYNDIEYSAHYFFINVVDDEIPYIGIEFIDYSGKNDVIFGVYGAKYDSIVDFDTMFKMVSGN